MARNRFLFDLLGVVAGLGILVPLAIFPNTGDNYGGLGFTALGAVIGGMVLGFLAYKNDGVKISAIISALITIFGIIIGVIMFAAGNTVAEAFSENIFTLFVGFAAGIGIILIGIIFIVVMIVSSLLFIGFAAIGSAIGEAVWKDKAGEQVDVDVSYQPIQQPTQPTQPTKAKDEVFCTNCGATNKITDEFCTSCGGKLKKQ